MGTFYHHASVLVQRGENLSRSRSQKLAVRLSAVLSKTLVAPKVTDLSANVGMACQRPRRSRHRIFRQVSVEEVRVAAEGILVPPETVWEEQK